MFATLPAVDIVASFVSLMPALSAMSSFIMVPSRILEVVMLLSLIVATPALVIIISPLTFRLFHKVPSDISILPSAGSVDPRAAPLIFDTTGSG